MVQSTCIGARTSRESLRADAEAAKLSIVGSIELAVAWMDDGSSGTKGGSL